MADKFAHYVQFARSLAMTSTIALQACSGATDSIDDPPPPATSTSPVASSTTSPVTPPPTPAPTATTTGEGGSGGSAPVVAGTGGAVEAPDAGDPDAAQPGHLSGPLPPPELPRSLVLA